MSKSPINHDLHDLTTVLKAFEGDAAAYKRVFERISRLIPCSQVLIVSTLPRGGTQITQPSNCPEGVFKAYARGLHAEDRPTWQAILRNKALAGPQCWEEGGFPSSVYLRELMEPNGLHSMAVAPLSAPVLSGYPGALHVYRGEGEADFSAGEVKLLGHVAEQLNEAILAHREARATRLNNEECAPAGEGEGRACCRQFVFDQNLNQVSLYEATKPADGRLSEEIRRQAERQLKHVNGELMAADRVQLPDATGNLWTFRTVLFKTYPALGRGAFVFLCLQPGPCEWEVVRPSDFQADAELVRLVPTLRFMRDEFSRNPTLDDIAAKAHLSPFHFHRRFTELLGQTPKHFLLACQIQHAKALLLERKTPLSEIASGCGFAHQSHFTSRFKQATGLTPTRWRRVAVEQQKTSEVSHPELMRTPGCAV